MIMTLRYHKRILLIIFKLKTSFQKCDFCGCQKVKKPRSSDRNHQKTTCLMQIRSLIFFVRNMRTTQFARRSRFKIHPLTGFSMSLDSPHNQHTSFTPSHANLAASAKQSRLVIELRNVVLCMTNVCQTRSVYEARRPKTCLMTCVKDG